MNINSFLNQFSTKNDYEQVFGKQPQHFKYKRSKEEIAFDLQLERKFSNSVEVQENYFYNRIPNKYLTYIESLIIRKVFFIQNNFVLYLLFFQDDILPIQILINLILQGVLALEIPIIFIKKIQKQKPKNCYVYFFNFIQLNQFILNFLACLPLFIFGNCKWLVLNQIIRFYRTNYMKVNGILDDIMYMIKLSILYSASFFSIKGIYSRKFDQFFIKTQQVLELIISIFCICFYISCIWSCIFYYQRDALPNNFYTVYDFWHKTPSQQFVIIIYFTCMTLSTVGYGDFCPQSPVEKCMCIIAMIIGIQIFSYIISQISSIFGEQFDQEIDKQFKGWIELLISPDGEVLLFQLENHQQFI